MKFLMGVFLMAGLTFSCAHGIKNAGDLKAGETYKVTHEGPLKDCDLTARNIVTRVPTPSGVSVPASFLGMEAMVCGELNCSKTLGQKSELECLPLEALK